MKDDNFGIRWTAGQPQGQSPQGFDISFHPQDRSAFSQGDYAEVPFQGHFNGRTFQGQLNVEREQLKGASHEWQPAVESKVKLWCEQNYSGVIRK